MAAALITDDELLALSLASDALAAIGSTVRASHRTAASDWVRNHLAVRISAAESDAFVPSDDVKECVAARACYTLLGRRGYNPQKGNDAAIAARLADAIAWLEKVRTCKVQLADYPPDRQAPKVGGTRTSAWDSWRSGGAESEEP